MKKAILCTICGLLACSLPTFAADESEGLPAPAAEVAVTADAMGEPGGVSLTVRGDVAHVQNAQDLYLEVYDITGKEVIRIRIESNDKTYDLNLRKGFYILRVGKLTKKISIS